MNEMATNPQTRPRVGATTELDYSGQWPERRAEALRATDAAVQLRPGQGLRTEMDTERGADDASSGWRQASEAFVKLYPRRHFLSIRARPDLSILRFVRVSHCLGR